jgi:hypothetical protein
MEFSEEQYRRRGEQWAKMVPGELAWGAMVAIMIERGSALQVLGSGTLFRIADRSFVITAAHVMQQGMGSTLRIIPADTPNSHKILSFAGDGILESTSNADVAALHLLPKVADQIDPTRFLRLDHISLSQNIDNGLFAVFGFPSMMSFPQGADLKVTKFSLMASIYEGDTDALENFDPRVHFAIEADSDDTRGEDGKPIDFTYPAGGVRANFPGDLGGISGGSVWMVAHNPQDRQEGCATARLVGVETGVHQKSQCIRATRWKEVIYLLLNAMPDLRPAIALSRGP